MDSYSAELPHELVSIFANPDLTDNLGLVVQLIVCDHDAGPRLALLSVGEVLAQSRHQLALALHAETGSARALASSARGLLAAVVERKLIKIQVAARPLTDLTSDLRLDGLDVPLRAFEAVPLSVTVDAVDYAELVHGIEYELPSADDVMDRWSRQRRWLASMGAEHG